MNYSQEELNQILLSKPLNEFYFAVIENRGELLTDEEYEKITRRNDNVYTGASKEDIDSLSEHFQEREKLKEFVPDLMKMVYSLARIRHIAILTMIDDEVYDIGNFEFVDLKTTAIDNEERITSEIRDKLLYDERSLKKFPTFVLQVLVFSDCFIIQAVLDSVMIDGAGIAILENDLIMLYKGDTLPEINGWAPDDAVDIIAFVK